MEEVVYIRMRQRVQAPPDSLVKLGDLAQIVTSEQLKEVIAALPIHLICESDQNIVVIDVMKVIQAIQTYDHTIDVQSIGPTQSIIEVMYKPRQFTLGLLAAVWFLLFIGAGLTIMNFHEDVSMQAVHQELYYIITGIEERKPLLLQIPYSLGLGLGMILFFNHLFRKRINEEPSPLEVEMFKYQQDLDQYVMVKENKESMKKIERDN